MTINNIIKEKAKNILEKSMEQLGISYDMKTDIKIINEILREMKLDLFQTSYVPMQDFLTQITLKPQDLEPMLRNITQGIQDKHPALIEFAQKALEKNWLSGSEYIKKSVHITFILEALTLAMTNNDIFFNEIVEYIYEKEKEIGIDHKNLFKTIRSTWPAVLNFFATAKAISLDPGMSYFKYKKELNKPSNIKNRIKKLYKKSDMSYMEFKLLHHNCKKKVCNCNDWLRINIYEAGITEYNSGFEKNALSAHVLSEDVLKNCNREIFKKGTIHPDNIKGDLYSKIEGKDNYFPTFNFSEEWVGLYQTWNMSFILGELNNLHYLFPKLMIPSVINAKNENFLGTRIIALWLTINNTIFLNFSPAKKVVGPKNRKEMVKAWGIINAKYAIELSDKQTNNSEEYLQESFKKRFKRPFLKLTKLILGFLS